MKKIFLLIGLIIALLFFIGCVELPDEMMCEAKSLGRCCLTVAPYSCTIASIAPCEEEGKYPTFMGCKYDEENNSCMPQFECVEKSEEELLCKTTGGEWIRPNCLPCPPGSVCEGCISYCKCPEEKNWEKEKGCVGVKDECSKDSDCWIRGCSGELCALKKDENPVTICVMREWYKCLNLTECGCFKGKCGWKENKPYLDCLKCEKTGGDWVERSLGAYCEECKWTECDCPEGKKWVEGVGCTKT